MLENLPVSTPSIPSKVYTEYQIHIVQSPTEPSFLTGEAVCGASQEKIGQHDERVCLEVGVKLLSHHTEG